MDGQLFNRNKTKFCVSHTNEELKYYCVSCKQNVCSDCILECHSLHVHSIQKSSVSGPKVKEVRFQEHCLNSELNKPKSDTELVEILSEIELCRRQTYDVDEALKTTINNRAEEILRHIKKTRNQLLEECQTITKQNNVYLNALENRIHLKLDTSHENEISKIFQHVISNNEESRSSYYSKNDLTEHDKSNITHPEIDIPIFVPGNVDMVSMRTMFGTISLQGNEKSFRYANHQMHLVTKEKENMEPSKNDLLNKTAPHVYPKEKYAAIGEEHSSDTSSDNYSIHKDNNFKENIIEKQKGFAYVQTNVEEIKSRRNQLEQHGDRFSVEARSHTQSGYSGFHNVVNSKENTREKQIGFAYVQTNAEEIKSTRDHLEQCGDIYAVVKKPRTAQQKSDEFPLFKSSNIVSENDEKLDFQISNFQTSEDIRPDVQQEEMPVKRRAFRAVLNFSVDCEEKPVCCLCVLGTDSCWIHQGFSTTNSLFCTVANKRKKIEYNFIVEDWTLKPPDTIIAADYNHRIVKLTPMGQSDNPLLATQNIGWSFHHVDLHPIAVTFCRNGNFLVSLVDSWSYKVDSNSRRQVIRMNDQFEPVQTIEFLGTKRLFTTPRRLAENTNGDFCVLDETSESRGQIIIFNREGLKKCVYTGRSDTIKHFNPNGICCDNESRIIISDYGNNRLHILDQNGQFLQYIVHQDIINPFSVTVDIANRFWIGLQSGKILVITLK